MNKIHFVLDIKQCAAFYEWIKLLQKTRINVLLWTGGFMELTIGPFEQSEELYLREYE